MMNTKQICLTLEITSAFIFIQLKSSMGSVTRLGDLFDFGQLFKAFGNN